MRIDIEDLSHRYPGEPRTLDRVGLTVEEGELMTLLGPSGSGKTTLLMLIAGFLDPLEGRILLGGRLASGGGAMVPPRRRALGMVFQDLALWPHLSVEEHLDFVLRARRVPRPERVREKEEILELVELGMSRGKLPHMLSGGEEQRLALARALVGRPRILLLDEPLGALDRRLRDKMLGLILRAHERLGTTTIHVTHDHEEALAAADRAAILDRGRIVQTGTPEEIYRFPASATAARTSGPVTLVDGKFLEGSRVELPFATPEAAFRAGVGSSVTVVLRPEGVEVLADPDGGGIVRTARFHAALWDVDVECAGTLVTGRASLCLSAGDKVKLVIREPVWGFAKSL